MGTQDPQTPSTQTDQQASQIVEELVKLRHIHRRSYRKREFTLWPKARVVWMRSARHLLVTDGLDLEEILAVLNFAFTQSQWPPKIRTVFDFRENYDTLLHEWLMSQIADLYPEGYRHAP